MLLHPRRTIGALALCLSAMSLSWLGWHAQAARSNRAAASRTTPAISGAATMSTRHRTTMAALATTFVVNSTADGTLAALSGNTTCDLREAVAAANTNAVVGQCPAGMAGLDTITFSVTGTIALAAGDLTLAEDVTITGPGANVLSVSGSNLSRVFSVNGVTATISGLTITGGNGVGAVSSGEGGGIFNFGNLTLTASHVTGNTAGSLGGGIRNSSGGTLTIERSAVTGNTTNFNITNSGGIVSSGMLFVTNSTVSGNRVTVAASTTGGGILSNGTATITASTITDNEAAGPNTVGGVLTFAGTVTVRNTIIATNRNNTTTPDVGVFGAGTFASQGYNLIGNPGAVTAFNQTGDQVGTAMTPLNPVLGPLAFNGGTTPTQRPLTGSPAIDKGNSFGLTTDQRGFPRPQDDPAIMPAMGGDNSDIGAVEIFQDSGAMSMLQLVVDPATNPAGAAQELINAIVQANEDPDPTTIKLICGTYTLTARNNTFYGFTGLPFIFTPVTIEGNGAVIERSTTAPAFRLFAVAGNADFDPTTGAALTPGSLTLRQVTLRNGLAQGGAGGEASDGGGGGGAGLGGAVYNRGTLTVEQSAFVTNRAVGGAGGNANVNTDGEGGGGGGLGGAGGASTQPTDAGSGGGGFGGAGGLGAADNDGGGGGGGTLTDGSPGSGDTGGAGGTLNGGMGGDFGMAGATGGYGGGGGGGGGFFGAGGAGGVGGGGGGGGPISPSGGMGGYGGGGGGAGLGSSGPGGTGGFGGGGGGGAAAGSNRSGGGGGFGAGRGGNANSGGNGGGGGGLGAGGAIFNDAGTLVVRNTTLSGNFAQGGAAGTGGDTPAQAGQGLGGAIFARNGTVTINNATLNNNSVTPGAGTAPTSALLPQGGALYLLGDAMVVRVGDATSVTFNVSNSIFANTPGAASDAFVNTINGGTAVPGTNNNNLVESNGSTPGADANDLPGVTKTDDPMLGALTMANCGPSGCRTPVHTITPSSPAFNMAGGNAETLDQCGTTRSQGGVADIGAFEVIVVTAPTISKMFSPTAIQTGASSTITLTLMNANAFAITGASFSDMLMGGLSATGSAVAGTCTGTMPTMLTAGQTSLNFTGITIPAASSCTISFAVTSSTPGPVNNQTSGVTSDQNTTAGSASNVATLTVVAPPTLSKTFNPTTINAGATSQLTLTFSNPAGNVALINLAVTDNLPAGVTIATTGAINTCGGMVTGATAGSTSFSLSGGALAAGASCQVQVTVTSTTPGTVTNTTTAPTATSGSVNVTGMPASAMLTVNPILPPSLSKMFGAATVPLGGTTGLTFTINNPNPSLALMGVAFTDTLPSGLVVATPNGLTNSCGGAVTATSGTGTISLSGGTVAAGGACTVVVNVMSTTLGEKNNSVQVTSTNGGTGNTATATVTVTPATGAPIVTIVDPLGCTGPGDVLTVTVTITNPAVIAQPVTFTATLPAGLVGIPGTGTSTVGAPPVVTAGSATFGPTVLAAGQTVTVTYQVQVGDAASGTQLCITTTSTFSGTAGPVVQACTMVNCPPIGPGLPFPATSEVSDQKAGSVLVYNLYSSNAAAPNTQNTRVSITNTNPALDIAVHLFFVDGQTCSIADAIICLTKNQTASFLASDLDPGTTGYVVAVASDPTTGCPVNFNFLIGDAYVKLASGHQANLGAEAFAALAGGPVACDGNSLTAQLNFDGVSYNRVPRTLAASSIPARTDGNDTLLIINRFGGNLAIGAATLTNLFGIFYDDAENGLSFGFSPGLCQFRSSLSNNFPRITPRLETFIPAGRSGWLRLYSTSDIGLLGAVLNFNPNATTNAGAFNQGRNLHKLTLTATQTLVIPIFPPNCLN